jgi:hypothetical protein
MVLRLLNDAVATADNAQYIVEYNREMMMIL